MPKYQYIEPGIYLYRTKNGKKRYNITFRVDGKTVRENAGSALTEARAALGGGRQELYEGQYKLKSKQTAPTVADYCDVYTDWAQEHKKSWKQTTLLRRPLSPPTTSGNTFTRFIS